MYYVDVQVFLLWLQVAGEITAFYRQTYINYEKTRDERLKETLRLIQTGVSSVRLNMCFFLLFGPKRKVACKLKYPSTMLWYKQKLLKTHWSSL